MKLTELQRHQIDLSLSYSASVLTQIKKKQLRGKNLEAMKVLETVVTNLEIFRLLKTN